MKMENLTLTIGAWPLTVQQWFERVYANGTGPLSASASVYVRRVLTSIFGDCQARASHSFGLALNKYFEVNLLLRHGYI